MTDRLPNAGAAPVEADTTAGKTPPEPLVVRLLRHTEDGFLVLLLLALVVLAGTQIVARNVFSAGFTWADGTLRVLVLWVGMAGAMVAAREDRQITVDVLTRLAGARVKNVIRAVTALFTAAVCLAVTWHGVRLVQGDRLDGMTAFGDVPVWVCELILPLAFGIIGLRYLIAVGRHLRRLRQGAGDVA